MRRQYSLRSLTWSVRTDNNYSQIILKGLILVHHHAQVTKYKIRCQCHRILYVLRKKNLVMGYYGWVHVHKPGFSTLWIKSIRNSNCQLDRIRIREGGLDNQGLHLLSTLLFQLSTILASSLLSRKLLEDPVRFLNSHNQWTVVPLAENSSSKARCTSPVTFTISVFKPTLMILMRTLGMMPLAARVNSVSASSITLRLGNSWRNDWGASKIMRWKIGIKWSIGMRIGDIRARWSSSSHLTKGFWWYTHNIWRNWRLHYELHR